MRLPGEDIAPKGSQFSIHPLPPPKKNHPLPKTSIDNIQRNKRPSIWVQIDYNLIFYQKRQNIFYQKKTNRTIASYRRCYCLCSLSRSLHLLSIATSFPCSTLCEKCPHAELFWSECRKIWTRITLNKDTFYTMTAFEFSLFQAPKR